MTTRWANAKKIAGLAAMATVVTAAGLGLGSGIAQARPSPRPNPTPHVASTTVLQRIDNFQDRLIPETRPFDAVLDRFYGGTP
jgi:hypothetical protein